MKKSLLVVPALGVMLLAAAGSVGGTVAWFSSVSSVNANIATFKSTAMDGNLALKVTADKGTENHTTGEPAETDYSTVYVEEDALLTHASYDHVNKILTTRSTEASDNSGVRNVTGVADWIAKSDYNGNEEGTPNIYWAVSWKMEFTFTFALEDSYVNLYFDPNSALVDLTGTSTTNGNTYQGFRIAFVPDTTANAIDNATANARVWAPYRQQAVTGVEPNNLEQAKYVHAATAAPTFAVDAYQGAAYASADDLIGSSYMVSNNKFGEGVVVTSETGASRVNGLLGQFKKNSSEGEHTYKISFVCVAWFEGTDSAITTTETLDHSSLSASLKFYAREANYEVNPA